MCTALQVHVADGSQRVVQLVQLLLIVTSVMWANKTMLLQAAKNLTNDQVHDLLHLRRMFYGRLGQLMLRRKQLLTQVPETGLHPSVQSHTGAQDMDQLAQQLKASGTDEYHAYTTFASVFFRGVRSYLLNGVCEYVVRLFVVFLQHKNKAQVNLVSSIWYRMAANLHALLHQCFSSSSVSGCLQRLRFQCECMAAVQRTYA